MKIPTILGMVLLFALTAAFVYITISTKNNPAQKLAFNNAPQNIEQNNISQNSITVTWQTSDLTPTELIVSKNPNMNPVLQDLKDNRDDDTSKTRLTHISTINELSPSNTYYIKIKSGEKLYPTSDTKIITTSISTPNFSGYNPVVGSVVNQNLQPENDALVFLLVNGAYPLSAGVGQDGNFILPLNQLVNQSDPSATIDPQALSDSSLLIIRENQKSQIKINITNNLKPLPPIVLGQNLDLRNLPVPSDQDTASPSATTF